MKLVRLQETVSTNQDAFHLLDTWDPVAVISRRQTGGRGRGDHTWSSPEGNLYLSVGMKCGIDSLRQLSVRTGVRLADALNRHLSRPVIRIKWPNDLMIGEKKVGGLLVESRTAGDRVRVVVGFGLNLTVAPVPESDMLAAWTHATPEVIATTAIEAILAALRNPEPEPLRTRLSELSWLQPGDTIRFMEGNEQRHGTVVGYNEALALVVKQDAGTEVLTASAVTRIRRKAEQ